MKRALQILVIGILLHLCSRVFGQGWERVYDFAPPRDVISLPDGDMIAYGFRTHRIGADGSPAWSFLHYFTDGGFSKASLSPRRAVLAPNGNITGIGMPRFVVQGPFAGEAALFQISRDSGLLWESYFNLAPGDSLYAGFQDLKLAADGGYYVLALISDSISTTNFPTLREPDIGLIKTDSLGQVEWRRNYPYEPYQPGLINATYGLQILPNGHVIIMGIGQSGILETDALGNEVRRFSIGQHNGEPFFRFGQILTLPDSCYLLFGHQYSSSGSSQPYSVARKIDADGQLLWETVLDDVAPCFNRAIALSQSGRILTLSNSSAPFGPPGIILHALDLDGNKLWWRHFRWPFYQSGRGIDEGPDGSILIAGSRTVYDPDVSGIISRGYLLKLDSLGRLYGSLAQGNLFEDLDGDCDTLPEAPLSGWLVELQGQQGYYGITDSLGNYRIPIDTGSYVARPIAPSAYWQACTPEAPVSITSNDTLRTNFPIQTAVECPSLQVDLSAAFLRRCFPGTYTVSYCNTGTVPAAGAYVEVKLDPSLSYQSATLPLAGQSGDTLAFQLGQVDVGECGQFNIALEVGCDSTVLGQTHCTTAHIYPDSICLPAPNWSGASVAVDGNCTGDSLHFTIRNVGTAPTSGPLEYIVIEDQVVLRQGTFNLQPNETEQISLPATGATVRLEAQQEPFHPGSSMPGVTIEGCGLQPGSFSLGYVTQYWEDDGDPFVSIDCQENIGAYDPNDKRAYPKGYGPEHFIESNTEIEYHIRFQNTGTDTAFTVVIEDPLDENLDLATIRPGAGSHPYTFEIKPGRLLSFRFDNILLPDSTTNEPASHGFVKFRVAQLPGLPDGTTIHNTAAIFFDFNEAIITNTTTHTIGRDFIPPAEFIPDEPEEERAITVYPNPFEEEAQIRIGGYVNSAPLRLELYDAAGRLLRKEQHEAAPFTFRRGTLPGGLYFYRISERGVAVSTGKVVIQ